MSVVIHDHPLDRLLQFMCVCACTCAACKLREHELPASLQHHQRALADAAAAAHSNTAPQHHVNQVHKKPRLVFTDIQRRTLLAIFKETRRPNKDMQATIAEQLGLKVSTVANFFMNARRRSLDKYLDDPPVLAAGSVPAVRTGHQQAPPPSQQAPPPLQQVPHGGVSLACLDVVDNGL